MIGHSIPVYRGYASQYGHGLGNVLGGLFRSAMPFVGNIAKSAGKQLLETGVDYVAKKLTKKRRSKRKKTRPVKRTISRLRKVNKRRMPPGKPARKRKVKTKHTPRDIFA